MQIIKYSIGGRLQRAVPAMGQLAKDSHFNPNVPYHGEGEALVHLPRSMVF